MVTKSGNIVEYLISDLYIKDHDKIISISPMTLFRGGGQFYLNRGVVIRPSLERWSPLDREGLGIPDNGGNTHKDPKRRWSFSLSTLGWACTDLS